MNKRILYMSALFISNMTLHGYNENLASYSGSTGIFETPNARIMPDWSMKIFASKDTPYNYYGIAVTPLPFLEANFHITQIDGVSGFDDSDSYGDYKDKAISFKLLLNHETEYFPSVVFGGEDVDGTGLFSSKYLAFGKRFSSFDITAGYAKGRLGGESIASTDSSNSGSLDNTAMNFIKDPDWSGGKVFGNVVVDLTPKLSAMAEYSQINYEKDRVNPFTSGSKYELPSSKINYGLKYQVSSNSNFAVSYQRGNQISFGYTYQFGFSRNGMFDHLPDPKWKADEKKLAQYKDVDNKTLSDKLSNEVAAEKLSNVRTSVNGSKIWSEFDNPRYDNDLKAIGRAISTIDEVAPAQYDTIYATLKVRNVPYKTIKVNRQEYDAFENGRVSSDYFTNAVVIEDDVEKMENEFSENKKDLYKTDITGTKPYTFYVGPSFKTYLNAKDKPFAMKISAMAQASYDITEGVFVKSNFLHPFYNSIQDIKSTYLESNELSIRSNMLDYYKYDNTQMQRLTLDYVLRAPFNSFAKAEVGYLDLAFAGTDLEWYKSFYDDRFGIGLQYQYVYKRPVDDMFEIYNDLTYDANFLNFYYLLSPRLDLHLGLKVGEFLAGDRGVRFDLTRNYKGFSVGAFATFTNSSEVFTNSQNQGYIDKGIYIKVPLDVFTYKNVKGRVNYGLSPWTRDVGQFAGTSYSLFPMNNSENNERIMKKNIFEIIE